MLAIICYPFMMREKKTRYYHLMTLAISKRKWMLGKIIYRGYVVLVTNTIVFAGASLCGVLLTTEVPVDGAAIAVLVLTIAQLWNFVQELQLILEGNIENILSEWVLGVSVFNYP